MTDLLAPLIDAYRAENSPDSLDSGALRSRILVAAARRHQSPLRRVRWLVVPVAAAFLATGALAATPTVRPALAQFFTQIARVLRVQPPPTTPPLSPHPDLPRLPVASDPAAASGPVSASGPAIASGPASASGPAIASGPASASALAQPPGAAGPLRMFVYKHAIASPATDPRHAAPHDSESAPAVSVPVPLVSPAPTPPPPAPPPLPPPAPDLSPDLAAYSVAHRLHFANGDYARALPSWNGYLARFPAGTFAPEARLNRAVCLARLGRTAEARTALTAIANGAHGGYGRAQAQRLLEALPSER